MGSRISIAVLLTVISATTARGDVLYLNQGGRVEGELLNPDQSPRQHYLVKTATGVQLTVPATQVERVVVKTEAERSYEGFAARLADTPEAHWGAAEKCAKAGLGEQRTFHLEQVVRLDPNHEGARHALGYSRIDGRWVRQSEAMEGKGYVRAGGVWRLPQELALEAAADGIEQKQVKWRKDLKIWRDWIVKGRDPQKVMQAEQSIRAIRDPLAAAPLVDLLTRDKEPAPLRLLYVDILGQLDSVESLATLVHLSLEDRDPNIRERCLDKIEKTKSKAAVREYIKRLGDDENLIVNRAAVALGRMKDPEAVPALIDALITTHKFTEGSGALSPTFSSDGGGGLSMGGGPKVVKKKLQNEPVLRTLTLLLPGVNFSFDQAAWKNWYKNANVPKSVGSLRRDS